MDDQSAAQVPYPFFDCKTLHLVRHGQAMHNVEGDKNPEALSSPELFDAQLSPLGLQQVTGLRKDVRVRGLLDEVELIITSPLSRAMQTAVGVFGREGQTISTVKGPQIMAVEVCRDRQGIRPCDMRRKVSECQFLFPWIDFSMMDDEVDNSWNPYARETPEELSTRVAKFLKWLLMRPEKVIVVVSHGIILQNILTNLLGNNNDPSIRAKSCKRFDHCELRSFGILLTSCSAPSVSSIDHEEQVLKRGSFQHVWPC